MEEKTLWLSDGGQRKVLRETPRYYVCKNSQFRKNSKRIMKITTKTKATTGKQNTETEAEA